jgi:hypothetical protein
MTLDLHFHSWVLNDILECSECVCIRSWALNDTCEYTERVCL